MEAADVHGAWAAGVAQIKFHAEQVLVDDGVERAFDDLDPLAGAELFRGHVVDAAEEFVKTRVTLFVEGWNAGSRLIPFEAKGQPLIQEWRLTGRLLRVRAMRGLPLTIRFAVTPESDWLYGVNISNWPEGYDSKDARPVEVELRHD